MSCEHLAVAGDPPALTPYADGCPGCGTSSHPRWVHLRHCLACGQVGCCDSSPSRHASEHAAASGHAVISSYEPGESWRWCYLDEMLG